jgi:hypothetical protein
MRDKTFYRIIYWAYFILGSGITVSVLIWMFFI